MQPHAYVLVTWLSVSVFAGIAPTAFAAEPPPPTLESVTGLPFVIAACVRTDAPPVIDGKLDDGCWQQTRPTRPFVSVAHWRMPWELSPLAEPQSTAYLLYDDKQLYVGVHCEAPQLESMTAADRIEIFLIPPDSDILAKSEEGLPYFHLVVNNRGTQYDEIGKNAPESFDGDWQATESSGGPDSAGFPLTLGISIPQDRSFAP